MHDQLKNNRGFTLVELVMVALVLSFVIVGVWRVYFHIVNTYYIAQRKSNTQIEGKRILDLIANGGNYAGERIYGLNSCHPDAAYPKVEKRSSADAVFDNDGDDFAISFRLDGASGDDPRYAEFSVKFTGSTSPTAKLYFRLRTPTLSGSAHDYDVLLTENLLQERYPQDNSNPGGYGSYNRTSFKAGLLPKSSTLSYSGIRISFYLVDSYENIGNTEFHAVLYNYDLDRIPDPPIDDSRQRSSFLGAIPYPQYFSTTIYFPNRID